MLSETLMPERRRTRARTRSTHQAVAFDALREALVVFGFFELSQAWMQLQVGRKGGEALAPEELQRMNALLEAIVMGAPA